MLLNAFIAGLNSDAIRQRLVKATDLSFVQAVCTAKSLELAHQNSGHYKQQLFSASLSSSNNAVPLPRDDSIVQLKEFRAAAASNQRNAVRNCYIWGDKKGT